MLVYLGIVSIAILVYFLWFHYDLFHVWYLSLKIDGPTPLPIIGSGLMFINKTLPGNFKVIATINAIKSTQINWVKCTSFWNWRFFSQNFNEKSPKSMKKIVNYHEKWECLAFLWPVHLKRTPDSVIYSLFNVIESRFIWDCCV